MTNLERDRYQIRPERTRPRTAEQKRARRLLRSTYTQLRIELKQERKAKR